MCTYTRFLPAIVGTVFTKERSDTTLEEQETNALVSAAFQTAIITLAKDSKTIIKQIPLSLIEGIKYYPLQPPQGYFIYEITGVLENKLKLPVDAKVGKKYIILPECPTKSVSNAYFVNVAVIPSKDICELDDEYCTYHYDTILANMLCQLTAQVSMKWFNIDLSRGYLGDYNRRLLDDRREDFKDIIPDGIIGRIISNILPEIAFNGDSKLVKSFDIIRAVTMAIYDSIKDVAHDTELYTFDIPVTLYSNSKFYPVEAPKGFELKRIKELLANTHRVPTGTTTNEGVITLKCCPTKDAPNAIYATIAVIPKFGNCDIDESFIEKHYELIIAATRIRIAQQLARQWGNPQAYRAMKIDYEKRLKKANRDKIGIIKLKRGRISDY